MCGPCRQVMGVPRHAHYTWCLSREMSSHEGNEEDDAGASEGEANFQSSLVASPNEHREEPERVEDGVLKESTEESNKEMQAELGEYSPLLIIL